MTQIESGNFSKTSQKTSIQMDLDHPKGWIIPPLSSAELIPLILQDILCRKTSSSPVVVAGNFQEETSNRIPPRAYETPSTITPCCFTRPPDLPSSSISIPINSKTDSAKEFWSQNLRCKKARNGANCRVSILFTPKMPPNLKNSA